MQVVRRLMLLGVAVVLGFGYSGCKKGAGEKAGEAVDKAAQDAGAAVGKAVQTAGRVRGEGRQGSSEVCPLIGTSILIREQACH